MLVTLTQKIVNFSLHFHYSGRLTLNTAAKLVKRTQMMKELCFPPPLTNLSSQVKNRSQTSP